MGRKAAVAAILGLALAVGAGASSARPRVPKIVSYKVTYQGSGTYSVDQTSPNGGGQDVTTAHFKWTVKYTLLIFQRPGQPVAGIGRSGSGSGDWKITVSGSSDPSENCSKSGDLKLATVKGDSGGITGKYQPSGKANLRVVPGGAPEPDFKTTQGASNAGGPCDTNDYWHDWVINFSKAGSGTGETVDPLTAIVTLTRRDQRSGRVIFNVSNQGEVLAAPSLVVNPGCDASPGECHQTFDWSGHVTLNKARSGAV